METMLVLVNPTDYGLQATEAAKVEAAFVPMLNKMKELEDEFNEIVTLPIEPTTIQKAKELRLKYVKIRTGCAEIHRKEKAFYLAGGKFVDGWKNAQLYASQDKEEKLEEIEKYYIIKEQKRRHLVKIERLELIAPYVEDPEIYDVANMLEAQFSQLLNGLKLARQQEEDAKVAAETARIEKEKADAEMRAENERLKAEAIEKERVAAIVRKQQEDDLAAERAKVAEAARIEKEKADKILADQKADAEKAQKAIEEKNRIERELATKKAAEERAKIEAAAKIEREKAEKIIAEQKRKAVEAEESRAIERAEAERILIELESMITCPNCQYKFHLQK